MKVHKNITFKIKFSMGYTEISALKIIHYTVVSYQCCMILFTANLVAIKWSLKLYKKIL